MNLNSSLSLVFIRNDLFIWLLQFILHCQESQPEYNITIKLLLESTGRVQTSTKAKNMPIHTSVNLQILVTGQYLCTYNGVGKLPHSNVYCMSVIELVTSQ